MYICSVGCGDRCCELVMCMYVVYDVVTCVSCELVMCMCVV